MLYNKSSGLEKLLDKWPGRNTLGMYRFLPLFFVLGAALEYSMINWTVGQTNFYKTFKRRQVQELIQKLNEEQSQRASSVN